MQGPGRILGVVAHPGHELRSEQRWQTEAIEVLTAVELCFRAVRRGGGVSILGVYAADLRVDDIITHRLPLADIAHAYDIFNKKEDGCVKVVLQP